MTIVYDSRFDDIKVKSLVYNAEVGKLVDIRKEGIGTSEYVTMGDLEVKFSASPYHIKKYLKRLGVAPFGEVKNVNEDGSPMRGVGKVAYRVSVVEEINQLLSLTVDLDKCREEAIAILEGMG